jgi:hypothetical protein
MAVFQKGLLVLGIVPTQCRLLNLLSGIFIAAVCGALYFMAHYTGIATLLTEK